MFADGLVKRYGQELVGKLVLTPPMGDYPGGLAIVTEIQPDPAAPEIALMVRNKSWTNPADSSNEIGIFSYGHVVLLEDKYKAPHKKFNVGDWVYGLGEHKGCSQVFEGYGKLQPFDYLDDLNPDNYRLATEEEIQKECSR